MRVYVHVDANGTYRGNGGAVMLLGLAYQLGNMGYDVAVFDHQDRLQADALVWTCYDVPPIVPFADVVSDDAPIVTTWLYGWLDTLQKHVDLWPRLRYWCSGELLRADSLHDAAREFVRDHVGAIAICNPSLGPHYCTLGLNPRWYWTNWVRDLFHPGEAVQPGTIGYQPDPNGDEALGFLQKRYGDRVVLCEGTQQEVADTMRRCDVFFAWNKLWPMTFGYGEAFGLSQYEALASGCKVIARMQPANLDASGLWLRSRLMDALNAIEYRLHAMSDGTHDQAVRWVNKTMRFDDRRAQHIQSYIESAA